MAIAVDENLIFIKEIKDKPELWDQYNNNYHNREVTEKIWNELSQKYSVSVEHLKTKWIGLRSQFRKCYLKQITFRKENPDKTIRVWKYFIPLLFLKDQMKKNKPRDANQPHCIDSDEEVADKVKKQFEEMEADYEESHETEYISIEQIPNIEGCNEVEEPASDGGWKSLIDSFQKDFEELEKHKAATIDKSKTDEDLLFLHSLLPYMKSLNFKRKLVLRTEIQKLVCNFITNLDDSYFDSVTRHENKSQEDITEESTLDTPNIEAPISNEEENVASCSIATENNEIMNKDVVAGEESEVNSENIYLENGITLRLNKDNSYIWLLNNE